jgi:hypothetical protein
MLAPVSGFARGLAALAAKNPKALLRKQKLSRLIAGFFSSSILY